MQPNDKLSNLIENLEPKRTALLQRFQAAIQSTPSLADPSPMGQGRSNRHGMPLVPPGQHVTDRWPVLDLGEHPTMPERQWRLTLDGACENPFSLSWSDFLALPQVEDVSDFHCVTKFSMLDKTWEGVRMVDLAAMAWPDDGATHILCHAYDGYSTNVPLAEALKSDVILAHSVDGQPLSVEHGGPLRMIVPQLYAWKGAKWIKRIEFLSGDRLGYWEERGYSNTAYPWRDDRYR